METMVLCSAAKGISSSFSLQQKHISDKNSHYCKINRHPFSLKLTKGLRFRTDGLLRSATSDEAWTGTTQTTSYVKDESEETTTQETLNVDDESKPAVETETASETTSESKDESEGEAATSQPESYLKEESEPKPEPEPEPEATTEPTSSLSVEAEPKPEAEPDSAVVAEASSTDGTQIKDEVPQDSFASIESFDLFKILEDAGIKFDSEDKYSLYVLGASGVTALWLTSTVLRAVDSIPVLPKVLELVGIGYTVWFSYRNLIFEEKRKELFGKIEQIKQEVIGSEED